MTEHPEYQDLRRDTERSQREAHDDIWGDERALVGEVLEWATSRVFRPSDRRSGARPASELLQAAGPTVTAAGIGAQRALQIFDRVLAPATRAQDDPLNLAYIAAAPTQAAVAFDLATSSANIFAGTWEAGAGAIFAENQAIAWLVELLGWPATAGGCFVSGGTIGNLSALVAARNAARIRRGGRPGAGWQVACTPGAHSSVRSAAAAMDVDIIDVPEDDSGHLVGAALRPVLATGDAVFAVVASAGTTNAGVVDRLDEVADLCAEFGVWMHVDGAYGGAALAAANARAKFRGIERADSFIVDPHKWLFAPYDCCALIYRSPELARAAHAQRASYLDRIDRESWNPTDLALHLSRRARGLPFWFSLACHGTDRYRAAVERTIDTARLVAAHIDAVPHLELLFEPDLSVLLFRRTGWSDADYQRWSQTMWQEAVMLCVPTTWRGQVVLRLAFVNPSTRADEVIAILDSTMSADRFTD